MSGLGVFILRAVTGVLYLLHGVPKLIGGQGSEDKVPSGAKQALGPGFEQSLQHGGIDNLSGFLGNIGVPQPRTMAWAVSLTETLGGLALIFGFRTRLAAFALSIVQLVAISKVHNKEGLSGAEYNLSLLAATTALTLPGGKKKDA